MVGASRFPCAETFRLLPEQGGILACFADIKHDYTQEFYQSYSSTGPEDQ